MMLWELLAPRRKLTAKKPLRWASNLGLGGAEHGLGPADHAALGRGDGGTGGEPWLGIVELD